MVTRNHFIKFLVDEIMRKSFAKCSDALDEVKRFSRTTEFDDYFEKWKKFYDEKGFRDSRPVRINAYIPAYLLEALAQKR